MTKVVVITAAVRRAKFQSHYHHQQANTKLFTGRMLFLSLNQHQSTVWKITCHICRYKRFLTTPIYICYSVTY